MLKAKNVVIILVLGCLMRPAAHAATTACPVEADTHILHGHGINGGYPDCGVARATNWVGANALFRFDLSGLEGYGADEIISATFKVYTAQGSGMMSHPMAPAGTRQRAEVLALRTWGYNHPYNVTFWTEAGTGDYQHGYIDGTTETQTGLPNIYDPGDVGGVDPYYYEDWGLNPGNPRTILSHDTGPYTWASVDLTDFVKAWLPGGDLDVPNNGIRIHDLGGWSGNPDPEFPEEYEWGWYFYTKDVGGDIPLGTDPHPGPGYVPRLEVDIIPEPASLALLVAGSLALLWRRRKRLRTT